MKFAELSVGQLAWRARWGRPHPRCGCRWNTKPGPEVTLTRGEDGKNPSVDDEYVVRLPLRHVLEAGGHEVSEAINGDEALQLFGESTFDLVLLDILMPDRDGLSTLGELLSKSPRAKVIVMSGKANFLPKARDLGAVETLWKPIDTETLLDTIERVLKRPQR